MLDLGEVYPEVEWVLMDLMGKEITQQKRFSTQNQMIVLPDSKGLYLLKVKIKGAGEWTQKIVKN